MHLKKTCTYFSDSKHVNVLSIQMTHSKYFCIWDCLRISCMHCIYYRCFPIYLKPLKITLYFFMYYKKSLIMLQTLFMDFHVLCNSLRNVNISLFGLHIFLFKIMIDLQMKFNRRLSTNKPSDSVPSFLGPMPNSESQMVNAERRRVGRARALALCASFLASPITFCKHNL